MKWKQEIYKAVTPPEARGREEFLKALPYPKLTYPAFVIAQIGYIRKRMWVLSAVILLAGTGTVCMNPDGNGMVLWVMAALVPFLAVFTSAEVSRSAVFGMAEIETGCRFALPQLTAARMLILGLCNFLVMAAGTVICGIFSPVGMVRAALYLLTPYISVCGMSLVVFDKVRGQDGVYVSGGLALVVSVTGVILFSDTVAESIRTGFSQLLPALCAAGMVLTVIEMKKILAGKEVVCYGIEN